MVFLGTAGLFVLLRAEFLAVVQVIVYVGAISVLILFAILMTQDAEQGSPPNRLRYPVGLLAFLLGVAAVFTALNTEWMLLADALQGTLTTEAAKMVNEVYSNTIPKIATLLLRDYVLAFEAVSVLLLAAIIGGARAGEGTMSLENFLILGAILFSIGLYGALSKRNRHRPLFLMCIELMFNAVNITAVALSRYIVPASLLGESATITDPGREGRCSQDRSSASSSSPWPQRKSRWA